MNNVPAISGVSPAQNALTFKSSARKGPMFGDYTSLPSDQLSTFSAKPGFSSYLPIIGAVAGFLISVPFLPSIMRKDYLFQDFKYLPSVATTLGGLAVGGVMSYIASQRQLHQTQYSLTQMHSATQRLDFLEKQARLPNTAVRKWVMQQLLSETGHKANKLKMNVLLDGLRDPEDNVVTTAKTLALNVLNDEGLEPYQRSLLTNLLDAFPAQVPQQVTTYVGGNGIMMPVSSMTYVRGAYSMRYQLLESQLKHALNSPEPIAAPQQLYNPMGMQWGAPSANDYAISPAILQAITDSAARNQRELVIAKN